MPVTFKLAIVAPSTMPTVTVLFVIAVSTCPLVPTILNASPPLTTSVLPLSPVIEKLVAISILLTAVIRPLLSTVNCGMFVASPYVPAVTVVLASVNSMLA